MITQSFDADISATCATQDTRSRQVVVAQHSRRGRSVTVRHGSSSEDGQDSTNVEPFCEGSSSTDRRIRQLTKGNAVWSGRRGASIDGATSRQLGYLLEFDDEGSLQQLPEVAACENFDIGALASLAAAMEPCEAGDSVACPRTASTEQEGLAGTVHHSGPAPEQHELSLAKRNLMNLYHGYGDNDGSLHQAQAQVVDHSILYLSLIHV